MGEETYHRGRAALIMLDAIITPAALAGVLAVSLAGCTLRYRYVRYNSNLGLGGGGKRLCVGYSRLVHIPSNLC
jgi:hypothetical protein